jgi:tetratricopeptide (TPR) repeat protein
MLYADLEVIVQRLPAGGHAVDLRFRAEPGDLDRELAINVPVQLDMARLLGSALDREAYGKELSRSLFADARLREGWVTARSSAESRDLPLRIRLRLDPGDPELHGICWEAVFDDQGVAVARSERFLLSRYLDSADMTRIKAPTRDELLALLVVASPKNLAGFGLQPFDAAAEVRRVRQSLADIPAATFVSGESGGPVTLPAIVDALRYGYSVLYLVCHGRLQGGVPYLALEDEAGEAEWVPGDELAARIGDLSGAMRPTLVVLASCQSVGVGHGSAVPAALGPQLARAGVAAVIGMQGDVPQETVARLMPRFFEQLAEDGQIDRALAVARTALRPHDPWWMPVLFLRARDGRLWREAPAPAAAPAKRTLPAPGSGRPPPRAVALWLGGALGLLALAALVLMGLRAAQREPGLPTAIVLATAEPAPAPTATLAPTPAPPAPLADGRLMILLGRIDAPAAGRDLSAELEADLRRTVEQVPFSNVEVRRYQGAVGSDTEAQELAQASRAAVVVWGGGTGPAPVLHVQIGATAAFPGIPPELSPELLRRTANVEVRLDLGAPVLPSPALAVLAVLNVLHSADGDAFEVQRVAALIDRLEAEIVPAEPIGGGSAPKVHRYLRHYFSDPELARPEIDAALDDDPGNPLLLVYSAVLFQRLGQYEDGFEDAQAAYDTAPGWASAGYLLWVDRLVKGFVPQSLAYLDEIVAARPEDSYALAYRGASYYLGGFDEAARADLELAIQVGSKTSLPYNLAAALALREGRIADAQALAAEARQRFQAQRSFDENFYSNLFGQDNILGLDMGAIEQLMVGQNRDAIASASQALMLESPLASERLRPDMHFVIGLAECRRGNAQAAIDAYSQALATDPDFALIYLLRAEARGQLGDVQGAAEDLNAAQTGPQALRLQPAIDAAYRGELSCASLIE